MHKFLFSTLLLVPGVVSTVGFGTSTAKAAEIYHPKTVVELFTSQGCYSCPAADALMGEFAKGTEILPLSLHVDYWDYLGWKDTFASRANTERQHRYARALKERQVYTPQAIVNGRAHAVGSREDQIRKIATFFDQTDKGMAVDINAALSGESLKVTIGADRAARDATLYMVFFNKEQTVKIARGENGGKTLSYHNVVHDVQPMGMVKADGLRMEYPIAEMKRSGFDSCALILQTSDRNGNPGAIVGATVISDL